MNEENLKEKVLVRLSEAKALRDVGDDRGAQRKEGEAAALAIYGDPKTTPPGGYGDAIFRFLYKMARNGGDAQDAFSMFSEDVVRGIRTLHSDSHLRAWLFQVARNALSRLKRGDPRKRETTANLKLQEMAQEYSTSWRKELEKQKDELAGLLDALDEEERTIVVLYATGSYSWMDVARILAESPDALDDAALKTEATRLKQRYRRAKEKLRELAQKKGLR